MFTGGFQSCSCNVQILTLLCLQSTLFNAICKNAKAQAANFPFCTIEPNIGVVAVPDDRLQVSNFLIHADVNTAYAATKPFMNADIE